MRAGGEGDPWETEELPIAGSDLRGEPRLFLADTCRFSTTPFTLLTEKTVVNVLRIFDKRESK